MNKLIKILPLLATSVALVGCQDEDFGFNAEQIAYEKDFVKTFGNIDPQQTWSMASRCDLTVTTADVMQTGGTYTMKVYTADPRSGQQACTLADIKVKANETVNFSVDYPFAQNYLAVALINEAGARVIRTVTIEDGKAKLDFNESSAAKAVTRTGGSYASVKTVNTSFGYDEITSTLDGFNAIKGAVSDAQIFLATGKNYTFFSKEDLEAYENICPESNDASSTPPSGSNRYAEIVNSGRVTSFSFRPVDENTDIVISPVYHYTSSNDHLEFRLTNITTGESTNWVDLTPSGFNGTHEFHGTNPVSDYLYFYDNRSTTTDGKGSWATKGHPSQLTTDMITDKHYYTGASIRSHSWVLRGLPNTYVINFRLNQSGGGSLFSYSEHMMNPFITAGSDADQIKVLPNAESFYTINADGVKGYYEQRASLVTVNDAVAYIGFEDAIQTSSIMPGEYDINDVVVQISGVETVDYSNVEDKSAEFLIACEDLGSNHDWDFNDVVFSVSPRTYGTSSDIHTDITFKLLASGGTLPLRVVYEPQDGHTAYSKIGAEEFTTISGSQNIFANSGSASTSADPDTHDVFGVARTTPVNVNATEGEDGKAPIASAVTIRDDNFSVATPAELKIKVWYTSDDTPTPGNVIPVKSEIGKVPSAFIVGNANWRWNDENISMADDDDFKTWATNHSTIGENWYAYKKGSIVINTVEGIDDVSKESFPTYAKIAASQFTEEMKTNGCVVQFSVSTTLSHVMKYSSVTLCRYPNDYEALDIPVLLDLDASNPQTGKHNTTLYDYTLGDKTTYQVELSAADVQRITEDGTSEGGLMLVGSLVNINTCSVMTYEAAGLSSEKAPYSSEFGLWKSISAPLDLPSCLVQNAGSTYTTGNNVSFDGKNYKLLSADVFYPFAHADATDGVNILLHMTGGNSSSKVSMIARDENGDWQKVIETDAPTAAGYASIHLNNRFIAETFANPVTSNMSGIAFNFTGSTSAAIDAIYVTTDAIAGVEGLEEIAGKTTPEPTGTGWTELTINHGDNPSNVEFTLVGVPSMYFGGEFYVSTSGAFSDSNGATMCNTYGYDCDESSTTFMHWTLTGAQLDGKTYKFYKAAQLVDGSGETEIFRAWVRPSAGPDMSAAGTQVLANDETGTKRTESGNIDLSAYTSNGAIVTVVFTRTNNGYYSAGNSSSSNLYVNNKSGINASGNWVTETFEVSADQLTADNILKITAGNMNIHSVYAAAITEEVLIAQEKAKYNTNTVITEAQTSSSVTITSSQIGEAGAKIYVVYSGNGSISASNADPTSVTVSGVGSATLEGTADSEVTLVPSNDAKIEAVYIKQNPKVKSTKTFENVSTSTIIDGSNFEGTKSVVKYNISGSGQIDAYTLYNSTYYQGTNWASTTVEKTYIGDDLVAAKSAGIKIASINNWGSFKVNIVITNYE